MRLDRRGGSLATCLLLALCVSKLLSFKRIAFIAHTNKPTCVCPFTDPLCSSYYG